MILQFHMDDFLCVVDYEPGHGFPNAPDERLESCIIESTHCHGKRLSPETEGSIERYMGDRLKAHDYRQYIAERKVCPC